MGSVEQLFGVDQWAVKPELVAAGFEPDTLSLVAVLADSQTLVPVGGPRCRDCGKHAERGLRNGDTHWPVRGKAIYCWACALSEIAP